MSPCTGPVPRRRRRPVALTAAFWIAWPVTIAAAITWSTGRYGFSPTDDEFVLAGSWRLLLGEVPHKDFVSARPVGSSILHLVDFALPGPLFLDGRLTTALEFVLTAASLLLLALPRGSRGTGQGLRRDVYIALAATAIALLNLHTFPLTPWHTVDGLACSAAGWLLIRDGLELESPARRRCGLLLTGFAAICKQSFAPVPLIAIVMLIVRRRACQWRSSRALTADAVALLGAPIAYVGWVAMAGGLHDAVQQLSASPPVWGRQLLVDPWHAAFADSATAVCLALFLAASLAWALGHASMPGSRMIAFTSAVMITLTLVGTLLGVTLGEPMGQGLVAFSGRGPEASSVVWWMCVILVVIDAVASRAVFGPGLAVCALAWMASLSWGYALPVLLQGTLAATALILTWTRVRALPPVPITLPQWLRIAAPTAGLSVIVAASVWLVLGQRATHEYRDATRNELTADLSSVAPGGRGIRTSPATAAYMRQLRSCIATHPAKWVAVLPDSAAAYPLLSLQNPFPSDWILPQELVGDAASRILATAGHLDKTGDYLVLFRDDEPLLAGINVRLSGQPVRCGSLSGRWRP